MSARRILSLWLGHLSTDRLARQNAAVNERPFATIENVRGAFILRHLNARAEANGLKPGGSLSDARALVPGLAVAHADQEADRRTLLSLARAADRYTPLVGLDPPDGLMLDITGCAHLFGGEDAMLADILSRFARWGYSAHGAVAPNPLLAYGLARFGPGGVFAKNAEDAFMALPVEALRLPEETSDVLVRLGLKLVGHVFAQPRAPLVQRFGPQIAQRLDQVIGHVSVPITPLTPVPQSISERRFAEPVMVLEGIAASLPGLTARLCEGLERRGEGARRTTLRLFHADCGVTDVAVGTSDPLADPKRMAKLLTARLERLAERIATDSGIDLVRLYGTETAPLVSQQGTLEGGRLSEADLAALVDTLCERLGRDAVTRLAPADDHRPGHEQTILKASETLHQTSHWSFAQTGVPPDRPLRLLWPPEPVETLASVPDGPPVRFVWRRVCHTVALAEGPERIASPWWDASHDAATCDYFRVEDSEGRRFFMFRQGLYGRESPPRWFMHGLFA